MSPGSRPGPPPSPPADLASRSLPITEVGEGSVLYRIHRTVKGPLHYGFSADAERRQRWDSPDGSYGVCYLAMAGHIAFAETLLRDLALDAVQEQELQLRSIARIEVVRPLRLVAMKGRSLRLVGADASVVQGPYEITWLWSAAFYEHPGEPDGILYRARHDDSGLSIALFERASLKVHHAGSVALLEPSQRAELARWLDRYRIGLTS